MIFIHEVIPPAGPKFAEGMMYNKNYMQPLVDTLIHLEALHILPDMTKIYRYYLYSLSADMHSHGNSIILRTSETHFFFIEISCNHQYDGSPRIYLSVDSFNGETDDLVFRGRVWDSGLGLIYSALNLVDRLSFYFRYRNHAMRFAEKFLTLLGLGFYKCVHDFERVLMMSYGFSAAEIFLDLFFHSPRPTQNRMSLYMKTEVKTIEKAFF